MTNADKFKQVFGLYATELWSMPEQDFLEWINSGALSCSEFPNSSDTIYRQDAIDAVKKNKFRLTFSEEQNCEGHVAWSAEAVYSDVMEGALSELPSAQPEREKGEWILVTDNNGQHYECSRCGAWRYHQEQEFCGSCGADMRGKNNGKTN